MEGLQEESAMAKLPVGIQSFESLRRDGYLYIDKTQYINLLVDNGKVYFLSRPRRFGKSLLLTTLEAYFQGKRELFRGLAIERHEARKPEDEQWIEYPVLKFSLSGGSYGTEEGLEEKLAFVLKEFEGTWNIPHYHASESERNIPAVLPVWLSYCIREAVRITGRQIVFLADEYDKALLENLSVDPVQEEKNQRLLKSFFSVLKDEDTYLKFVFFTGVTKFSKVSIFSDLNQLEDISLADKYGCICGITEEEVRSELDAEIVNMAGANDMTRDECLSELASMYDGYHFSAKSESVYNPFSLLTALKQEKFGSYWFSTGTPTFLIRKLQSSRFRPVDFSNGVKSTERAMSDYRADNTDPVPLFYQAGYLTITGYDRRFRQYELAFPNEEVRNGFAESILLPARRSCTYGSSYCQRQNGLRGGRRRSDLLV